MTKYTNINYLKAPSPPVITPVKYGCLYNWFTASDIRNIAPVGYHVPTWTEYAELADELGGYLIAGGKLKEIGTSYWNTPNTGANNSSGFNGRGNGVRANNGTFMNLKEVTTYWTINPHSSSPIYAFGATLYFNSAVLSISSLNDKKNGSPMRLIKDDSIDNGMMIGNDRKLYPTLKIGNKVWVIADLMETKFRNGDIITVVDNNSVWAAMTTAAICYYDNDPLNQ